MGYTPGAISNWIGGGLSNLLYNNNTGLKPGTWSVNNFKLPEFGVTEAFASDTPTGSVQGDQTSNDPYVNKLNTDPFTPKPPATNTLSGAGTTTQQQDPLSGAAGAAQSEGDAYLRQLQTEYDRNAEELRAQLGQAGTAREQGLSSLRSAVDEYGNVIGKQKASAEQTTAKNIQSAGSTAAQTQAKSRNVLRALGILSSSAAGDILNRPMTEFGTQKADLQQGLIQRTQELDDALAQKTSEHASLVKNLESQYAEIVGNIQRDLRFSDRERADAVAAAKSAVLSRLSEIRTAQAQWQNDINAAKNGLTASTTNLSSYTNPTADTSAIASTGLSTTEQYKPNTNQVGIYGDQRKKLTDTIPSTYA